MCWFPRPIRYCRWIFSCFGVAQHPDSPIPFAWVIRDYTNQDALLCKGREPEGSGRGWAFLQRRSRKAFLWPQRNWPWQLRRCLLCTEMHIFTLTHAKEKHTRTWQKLYMLIRDTIVKYRKTASSDSTLFCKYRFYTVPWWSWNCNQFCDPNLSLYLISWFIPFCE